MTNSIGTKVRQMVSLSTVRLPGEFYMQRVMNQALASIDMNGTRITDWMNKCVGVSADSDLDSFLLDRRYQSQPRCCFLFLE